MPTRRSQYTPIRSWHVENVSRKYSTRRDTKWTSVNNSLNHTEFHNSSLHVARTALRSSRIAQLLHLPHIPPTIIATRIVEYIPKDVRPLTLEHIFEQTRMRYKLVQSHLDASIEFLNKTFGYYGSTTIRLRLNPPKKDCSSEEWGSAKSSLPFSLVHTLSSAKKNPRE